MNIIYFLNIACTSSIKQDIKIDEVKNQCKRVYNHIEKNGEVPNRVLCYTGKNDYTYVDIRHWIYYIAKTIVYYDTNMKLPNYTLYNSNQFVKPAPKPKSYSEEILDYFISKFGNVSCIDDALAKIRNRGYGYYYDDRYSNKTSIDRMRNGQGVNCTDASQLFWHIGKALGYDVKAIHIKCRGGDGHIRLQFNKNGSGWFNRDPASVLDGECVECIWCGNGTYLATNPQWFMSNLYK